MTREPRTANSMTTTSMTAIYAIGIGEDLVGPGEHRRIRSVSR